MKVNRGRIGEISEYYEISLLGVNVIAQKNIAGVWFTYVFWAGHNDESPVRTIEAFTGKTARARARRSIVTIAKTIKQIKEVKPCTFPTP